MRVSICLPFITFFSFSLAQLEQASKSVEPENQIQQDTQVLQDNVKDENLDLELTKLKRLTEQDMKGLEADVDGIDDDYDDADADVYRPIYRPRRCMRTCVCRFRRRFGRFVRFGRGRGRMGPRRCRCRVRCVSRY